MHSFSQYPSFASRLFDGHPLGNDSRLIVTQPTWTARGRCSVRNLAGFRVDILLGMCDLSPGTSWFCDCRTSFIAYPLFAMTCTLQNSLSPSSLNSMPIPEFL
jgi:hypothetical protein